MHKILTALAATVAGAATAVGLVSAPADAAAPTVTIRPAQLERGANPATPYLRGGEVVDGTRRVDVPGRHAQLLGRSDDGGYVVVSLVGRTWTTTRVTGESSVTVVEGPLPEQVTLSDDGGIVAVATYLRRRTRVETYIVSTGDLIRRGLFARFPRVLDVQGARAVVGGPDGGYLWNLRTNRRTLLDSGFVYAADLGADRLASFDRDPYEGGCSQVSDLFSPRDLLWASCVESVREFSPDGGRIVTQHKLTDGIGAGRLRERTVQGRLLATYDAPSYFGKVAWESDDTLLLDTYGQRKGATVRCSEGECERASALRPNPLA